MLFLGYFHKDGLNCWITYVFKRNISYQSFSFVHLWFGFTGKFFEFWGDWDCFMAQCNCLWEFFFVLSWKLWNKWDLEELPEPNLEFWILFLKVSQLPEYSVSYEKVFEEQNVCLLHTCALLFGSGLFP